MDKDIRDAVAQIGTALLHQDATNDGVEDRLTGLEKDLSVLSNALLSGWLVLALISAGLLLHLSRW